MPPMARDDQLAQLVAIAGKSRRLAGIVCAWRRRGASSCDLAAVQADLVSRCWAAIAEAARDLAEGKALPEPIGLCLVNRGRRPVRSGRGGNSVDTKEPGPLHGPGTPQ